MPQTNRNEMEKRRSAEARREATVAHNLEVFKTARRALWEQKTDVAIAKAQRQKRVMDLSSKRYASLTERRCKVAELYTEEAGAWRDELQKNGATETPEVRKIRLETRALALKETRERERRAYVEDCYARQRRLACDDVRTRDSQALLDLVNDERRVQSEVSAVKRKEDEERKKTESAEFLQRLQQADDDEAMKLAGNTKRCDEVKRALDAQVLALNERRTRAAARKRQEDQDEYDEWKQATDAEKTKLNQARLDARARGKRVQKLNRDAEQKRSLEAQEERRQDLLLLDYALHLEDQANKKDAARLQDEELMAQRYKSYLDGFARKQELDEANLNAERLRLENRIWEAKDQEQKNQTDARNYLRAQVHAGRQEQMALQQARLQKDRDDRLKEIQHIHDIQDSLDKEEALHIQKRQNANLHNKAYIRDQIHSKKNRNLLEQQAAYLEAKMQQKVEEAHALDVANQGGIANLHHHLKNTNWYT